MAKVLVRLTMFAEPVEVDEDEIGNLRSQGLLIEDQPQGAGDREGDAGSATDGEAGADGPSPSITRPAVHQQPEN